MNKPVLRIIAVFCLMLVGIHSQAASVETVRAYRAPEYTRLVFDLSGTVEHELFTLEGPDRIVVDLSNVSLNTDFSELDLSDTPISTIRSAGRSGNDYRVVFDLNKKVQPRSFLLEPNDQYGDRLVIDFYDQDSASKKTVVRRSSDEIANSKRDIVVAISQVTGARIPVPSGSSVCRKKR